MKFGVIVFPGSNCDHDAYHVVSKHVGQPVDFVWHRQTDLDEYDALIVPGGFSYGDYLRAGALAQFSPVMTAVKEFAARGKFVFGICNGFQILCEAHLLPGALIRNDVRVFVCKDQDLRVESADTTWTSDFTQDQVIRLVLKSGEGGYVADEETMRRLEGEGRVVFRYVSGNPNGSFHDIAGICNERGNVVGLMPHPEHNVDSLTGPTQDGRRIFSSVSGFLTAKV